MCYNTRMKDKYLITDIVEQKKDNTRRSIYINNQFVFGMTDVDVLYYKLKIGEEIDKAKYNYILNEVIYNKAQNTALAFLSRKMRTKQEVIKKLGEKDFSEEIISKVVEFLENYKYLNDKDYIEKFVRDKVKVNGHGKQKIMFELKQKGVDKFLIEDYFCEDEDFEDEEYKKAYELACKKASRLDLNEYKEKKRVFDYLARRGFSYDVINRCMYDITEK